MKKNGDFIDVCARAGTFKWHGFYEINMLHGCVVHDVHRNTLSHARSTSIRSGVFNVFTPLLQKSQPRHANCLLDNSGIPLWHAIL